MRRAEYRYQRTIAFSENATTWTLDGSKVAAEKLRAKRSDVEIFNSFTQQHPCLGIVRSRYLTVLFISQTTAVKLNSAARRSKARGRVRRSVEQWEQTLAAIAAIGTTLALPGLGLLIAGPIAAGLAGAGAGGATGGLIGALVGAGIPEERVKKYEEGVKQGGSTSNSNSANGNSNLNSNTAPANVGVVQNNNGNQNTSGVRPINSNNANSTPNSNASPGNKNN